MKALIMTLCLAALTLPAAAQEDKEGGSPPDPKQAAQRMLERLDKKLKLSAEQKAKIEPIIEASASEKFELMKKMREMESASHEKVRAILTDEQKERWDMMRAKRKLIKGKMREKMRKKMKGMGREGQGPRPKAGPGEAAP